MTARKGIIFRKKIDVHKKIKKKKKKKKERITCTSQVRCSNWDHARERYVFFAFKVHHMSSETESASFFGSNIRIPMILSQNNVTYLHRSESTSTASENTNRWCFQPCYCSKKKTVPRITCFLKIVYDNIQNMPYFLMLISFQIPTSCISIYLFWIFDLLGSNKQNFHMLNINIKIFETRIVVTQDETKNLSLSLGGQPLVTK